VVDAVLKLADEARADTGVIVPIGEVPDVGLGTVSVRGEVVQLWEPGHPTIQDVGLIADDSGQIKFTTWTKSGCRSLTDGECIRFRAAATNWYQGRCSLALTGESRVEFPSQEAWWTR
jgi:ssDNA-binding replication factor A large subunit